MTPHEHDDSGSPGARGVPGGGAPQSLRPGISAVVPVYNSAEGLGDLLGRLSRVLEDLGRPYEVILVDDGSADESWRVIREQAKRFPWLRGIQLMRNYGQHNALLCGVRAARHDTLVTLDDDLQNPPEEIPRLVAKLEEGYDVVYGTTPRRQHSLAHNLASRLLKVALTFALGAETARMVSPLRAFRTRLREGFETNRSPWVMLDVFLTWTTTRFASIPVEHAAREQGRSGYTLRRRLALGFDLITSFSTLPLKLASLVGFGFTLFGLAMLIYVFAMVVIHGRTVPGWAFLASAIAIFSGAQLFALGIVGEYLARMFVRIMERPPYFVGETTGDD